MKSKAFRLALPRKSRLATLLSLVVTASLLTPFVPGALSASGAGSPISAPRAAVRPAAFAVAPLITATKTDAFPSHPSGQAEPGDTITYTVQINNNGTDATGVVFSDTVDSNTTWNGVFTTTPVAINDTYSAIGNVQINVPAASGLTSNDADPDGGPVTAVAGTTLSANGGNVTVNTDGSFSYNPPAGFEGADTFTYNINGASAPSDSATATVNVAGMIWFVNAAASPGGDGRLTSPFSTLTGPGSFDATAADQANDNIFLYSGAYTGGLSLLSGQAFIGAGSTASLSTVTGLSNSYSTLPATGGLNPVIGGASGISIATNNLIRGVTIQNTAGTGISGTAFGTLAVADTAVNSNGPALDLDNGELQTSFQSLTSTGSAMPGVSLSNIAVGSNFNGGTTSINGRTTTGIELDTVGGIIAFGATTIPNLGGAGGYGISVKNSTAAVSFASATISDSNQTIAQADADANLIPETDGDGDAIFLSNNSGSFAVNGGVLSNCGNDCVDARNTSNVSLTGVAINNPGVDATGASGTGGSGIQAINLSGANSLTSVNVQNFNAANRDGMRIINAGATSLTMNVGLSLFADSTSAGNGIVVSARDSASVSLVVQNNSTFRNILGPAIANRAGDNPSSTATANLTVQGSTFQTAPTNGQNTVHASTTQGGKSTVLVDGNTFDNVARTISDTSGVIDINGDATLAGNSLSVTVTNNVIQNIGSNVAGSCGTLACTARRGIDVFIDDNTIVSGTVVIDGNQINDVKRAGIILDISSIFNGSNVAAKVTNNQLGTVTRVGTGTALSAGGENGIIVTNRNPNAKSLNLNLSNNTVRNGNGGSGSAINTVGVLIRDQNSARTDATLTGNDIETSTSTVVAELRVDTISATSFLCLDANGNILDVGNGRIALNRAASSTFNVEQGPTAADLATANGIPAANVTATGSPTFGVACAAPPTAFFRSNPAVEYLASLKGPTLKAARGLGRLSEMLPGLDAWRGNWKQTFGGLSYRNAAASVALGTNLYDPFVRPARESVTTASALTAVASPAPFSGETVTVNIGTLPAGKSMTITFQVTINNSFSGTQVSNQGTVSGSNFSPVVTDDPQTGAFGDPTVTPVFAGKPPEISCPADIVEDTDPGQYSASVAFTVTATGNPAPTIDCKVGSTSITSPHTFPVGTTTVQCTATNGVSPDDSCSFNVTVNDDETPTISCPANITTGTSSSSCDATVNVGTPTYSDNDPNVTVVGVRSDSQPLSAPYPKGTTTITWTATDTAGNSASCQQTVTVNDDDKPVITLNGSNPMTVECGTAFNDPGATANDNCDGTFPATPSGSVNTSVPGTYTLTYNATDSSGNSATPVTRTVIVVDTGLPVITVNSLAPSLWPANHKYVTFNVSDFVTGVNDSCSGALPVSNVIVEKITSDETENGNGDGNTLKDIVIGANCKSFQVRSERDGSGNGRVYTVTFAIVDSSGNIGRQTVKIVVPKNPGQTPIDSGVNYTVNGSCGP